MRSIVTRFEQGGAHDDEEHDGKSYVKVIVQYQFRTGAGSQTVHLDCSQPPNNLCFQQYHVDLIKLLDESGRLNVENGVAGLEVHNTAYSNLDSIQGKIW